MDTQIQSEISKSDSIKELATALSKFQGEVGAAKKDSENPFFKSKYASLESVVNAIKQPLSQNGLSYSQFPAGKNKLVTLLMHQSGEWVLSTVEMTPTDSKPQALGSAISYARRYSISAILGLATGEGEDDGNSASATVKTIQVKTGKVGSEDAYAKAVSAVDKYTTTTQLEAALVKLETSKKFTDGQKDALEKMITEKMNGMIDREY